MKRGLNTKELVSMSIIYYEDSSNIMRVLAKKNEQRSKRIQLSSKIASNMLNVQRVVRLVSLESQNERKKTYFEQFHQPSQIL